LQSADVRFSASAELFLSGPIKIGKRIAAQLAREVFAIVATIIEDT
jgi:hypothetical protein